MERRDRMGGLCSTEDSLQFHGVTLTTHIIMFRLDRW